MEMANAGVVGDSRAKTILNVTEFRFLSGLAANRKAALIKNGSRILIQSRVKI